MAPMSDGARIRKKVYLVWDADPETGENLSLVAVRLSFFAAHGVAKEKGDRRIERWFATKEPSLSDRDVPLAREKGSDDDGLDSNQPPQKTSVHA